MLTVEDNGAGFEPDAARPDRSEGVGLLGIQERVMDARGTFRVESAPGRGTRITVELPSLGPPPGDREAGPADAPASPTLSTGGRA